MARHARLLRVNTPPHEPLIRRVLGANFFALALHRLTIEELDGGSSVKLAASRHWKAASPAHGLPPALFIIRRAFARPVDDRAARSRH